MKHPHAVSLAKRLLDSHIKLHPAQPALPMPNAEELSSAIEILSTHLDACMKQRIQPDLCEAVNEALDFALRHEKAYEPIPHVLRWRSALVLLEEQDAD
jgi:hypothetical protein